MLHDAQWDTLLSGLTSPSPTARGPVDAVSRNTPFLRPLGSAPHTAVVLQSQGQQHQQQAHAQLSPQIPEPAWPPQQAASYLPQPSSSDLLQHAYAYAARTFVNPQQQQQHSAALPHQQQLNQQHPQHQALYDYQHPPAQHPHQLRQRHQHDQQYHHQQQPPQQRQHQPQQQQEQYQQHQSQKYQEQHHEDHQRARYPYHSQDSHQQHARLQQPQQQQHQLQHPQQPQPVPRPHASPFQSQHLQQPQGPHQPRQQHEQQDHNGRPHIPGHPQPQIVRYSQQPERQEHQQQQQSHHQQSGSQDQRLPQPPQQPNTTTPAQQPGSHQERQQSGTGLAASTTRNRNEDNVADEDDEDGEDAENIGNSDDQDPDEAQFKCAMKEMLAKYGPKMIAGTSTTGSKAKAENVTARAEWIRGFIRAQVQMMSEDFNLSEAVCRRRIMPGAGSVDIRKSSLQNQWRHWRVKTGKEAKKHANQTKKDHGSEAYDRWNKFKHDPSRSQEENDRWAKEEEKDIKEMKAWYKTRVVKHEVTSAESAITDLNGKLSELAVTANDLHGINLIAFVSHPEGNVPAAVTGTEHSRRLLKMAVKRIRNKNYSADSICNSFWALTIVHPTWSYLRPDARLTHSVDAIKHITEDDIAEDTDVSWAICHGVLTNRLFRIADGAVSKLCKATKLGPELLEAERVWSHMSKQRTKIPFKNLFTHLSKMGLKVIGWPAVARPLLKDDDGSLVAE